MQPDLDRAGLLVVVGMFVGLFCLGWWSSRQKRGEGSAADFIVAGRSMPLWIAIMTMTATWVDGGFLLGTSEYTYKHGLPSGVQGGLCFSLSLILGGIFFTRPIRKMEHNTMVDIFEMRFGKKWAAILSLPAILGEIFWSGALLVAIGATFQVLLHLNLVTAIWVSAGVVTVYTMIGGMWSIAYTDVLQLGLVAIGLLVAIFFAAHEVPGGLAHCWALFSQFHQMTPAFSVASIFPSTAWALPDSVSWWDMSCMLVLGGIPWNCYFQRVLSCESPEKARLHSVLAGLLTLLLTVPPLMIGILAFGYWGPYGLDEPSITLPLVLRTLTPYWVMLLGLVMIVGAVTSSFSASVLSVGAMFSWNIVHRLLGFHLDRRQFVRLVRSSIFFVGFLAVALALQVKSIASLWLFTSDLVFVLLFPQLTMALFDSKTNTTGSIVGFCCSLFIRMSGGISMETDQGLLGFAAFIPYPELISTWFSINPAEWYNKIGATLFPIKSFSAVVGLIAIPLVSRFSLCRKSRARTCISSFPDL